MKKKVLMLGLLSLAIANAYAIGNIWSLDSLRTRAVVNNKSLLMAEPTNQPLQTICQRFLPMAHICTPVVSCRCLAMIKSKPFRISVPDFQLWCQTLLRLLRK